MLRHRILSRAAEQAMNSDTARPGKPIKEARINRSKLMDRQCEEVHVNKLIRTAMHCCFALVAGATCTQGLAQSSYPNKPVRLIVPFPPGGSNDIVARLIGQELSASLGQQFIVDNRGGASGAIGAEAVAKS